MRTHLVILLAFALALLTAAIPVAASDGQHGPNTAFQEFDRPGSAAPAAHKGVVPIVTDTSKAAAALGPSAKPSAVGSSVEQTTSSSLGPVGILKSILAFLAPSKEDLEKTMDSLMTPKDEPNARPGPHWPSSSAARGRF